MKKTIQEIQLIYKNYSIVFFIIILFLTSSNNISAQYSSHTITFENGFSNLYIDTLQPNNIWQIGKPQKILFDSAYTKPNAVITDTVNPYPINNTSSFVVKILQDGWGWSPNFPGPFPYIEFMHKYNTDTIADGGHLEYSVDAGINWQPVQIYENNWGPFTLGSTEPYFSGTFNQWWNKTYIRFNDGENGYVGLIDSILIKFIFTSDGINTNKEGWVIDNIRYGTDIGSGVETFNGTQSFNTYPNPVNNEFTVTFIETGTMNSELEIYNILGEMVSQSKIQNSKSKINISDLPKGVYFVKLISDKQIITKKIVKE